MCICKWHAKIWHNNQFIQHGDLAKLDLLSSTNFPLSEFLTKKPSEKVLSWNIYKVKIEIRRTYEQHKLSELDKISKRSRASIEFVIIVGKSRTKAKLILK